MPTKKPSGGFTAEERAAMKERAVEAQKEKAGGSAAKKAAADLEDCLGKIKEMPKADRVIAESLHEIATTTGLAAKTWYGMPAYTKDGKVVVFFKPAAKFKVRYGEVGFNEPAQLDDGDMWATAYAVTTMNASVEKKLKALVKKAAG